MASVCGGMGYPPLLICLGCIVLASPIGMAQMFMCEVILGQNACNKSSKKIHVKKTAWRTCYDGQEIVCTKTSLYVPSESFIYWG